MMNPAALFKIKGAWEKFCAAHPKFPAFMQAASQGMMQAGSIVDITVTAPDGRKISTNVRLSEEDMELFKSLK